METPDTPAQKEARELYNKACRDLATASANLREATARYERAHESYMHALGCATQAGVSV